MYPKNENIRSQVHFRDELFRQSSARRFDVVCEPVGYASKEGVFYFRQLDQSIISTSNLEL